MRASSGIVHISCADVVKQYGYEMKCLLCGDKITNRISSAKYCSSKCCREADRLRKNERNNGVHVDGICECCGNQFIKYSSRSKYCSDKCRRKSYSMSEENKQHRRNYSKMHRRRYDGISTNPDITLFRLAEKYNHTCAICGLPVNWADKVKHNNITICGNDYPSIDHIVPISKGGLHAWDNVQLAHRICNIIKSNKIDI